MRTELGSDVVSNVGRQTDEVPGGRTVVLPEFGAKGVHGLSVKGLLAGLLGLLWDRPKPGSGEIANPPELLLDRTT